MHDAFDNDQNQAQTLSTPVQRKLTKKPSSLFSSLSVLTSKSKHVE